MSNEDPVAGDQLKIIVQRIERLQEEKKSIGEDIAEVYSEAKANGYDTKVLRKVIALRGRDLNERREEEAILDLYLQAVGEDRDVPAKSKAQAKAEKKGIETAEQLYEAAVRLVRTERRASSSYLQRRMGIGYNRAAQFMDTMERYGIVGPVNDAGQRAVLAPPYEVVSDAETAAREFKETLEKAGATVTIVATEGSVADKAAQALEKAGAPVTRVAKPLVGSFTPPKERDPFGSDD